MNLETVFIDVAVGEQDHDRPGMKRRRIEIRASERVLTQTTEFDVEKVRAEAHWALDSALDEIATVINLYKSKVKVKT